MTADDEASQQAADPGVDDRLARHGGISYLHIPAVDINQSADFYETVLGWHVHRRSPDRAGFEDATRHVGGAFVTDQAVSSTPGLLPYIYVDSVDGVLAQVVAHGGEVVTAPYPEGNLSVATFRDPAGNVMGLWQEVP